MNNNHDFLWASIDIGINVNILIINNLNKNYES